MVGLAPTNGGSVPVPDPTTLTQNAVDALRKELSDLFDAKFEVSSAKRDGLTAVIEQRLDGIDKATELSRANLPTVVNEQIEHLKELILEKFDSIATQFKERDTRSERESRDNKVAVDAAFAAQKEAASEQNKSNTLAIDKSEKATAETLTKQADLFKSTTDALAAQLTDAKERLTRIEERKAGGEDTKTSLFALIGVIGVIAVIVFGVLGYIVAGPGASDAPATPDPVVVEVPVNNP